MAENPSRTMEHQSAGKPVTLHILKDANARYPLELIAQQAESQKVAVLLIQAAVNIDPPDLDVPLFVYSDELDPEQEGPYRKINAAEMLALIFEAEGVRTW